MAAAMVTAAGSAWQLGRPGRDHWQSLADHYRHRGLPCSRISPFMLACNHVTIRMAARRTIAKTYLHREARPSLPAAFTFNVFMFIFYTGSYFSRVHT